MEQVDPKLIEETIDDISAVRIALNILASYDPPDSEWVEMLQSAFVGTHVARQRLVSLLGRDEPAAARGFSAEVEAILEDARL